MNVESKELEFNKCVGCGLCEVLFNNNAIMKTNSKGFIRPFFNNSYDQKRIQNFCPISNAPDKYSNNIWGHFEAVYLGASLNSHISEVGSSGGIITQVLLYLLESKAVDGIIHIGANNNNPLENITYVSKSKDDIIRNAGSRYAPASPLSRLVEFLDQDMKYAFVGKPCDIRALKNYALENPLVNEKIIYTISFFCAGTPSYRGTDKVLEKMNASSNDVIEFKYRGNGWPGFATAITQNGESKSMTYNESWGGILRKYVQPYCRWCADGVGEFADISCGDAWHLDTDNNPIFTENKGRNVIFARTKQGKRILEKMLENKLIDIVDFADDLSFLKCMNYYQYYRKATMMGKILALRLLRFDTPKYNVSTLWSWSHNIKFKHNFKAFVGTILRKLQKKF